ncbi:MAG: VOC family protein, partial [Chloroflexota bacterium]|nr:VOC family protein [Chloroflexota bacterium]
ISTMLAVTNLARSVTYYCDALGFEVRDRADHIALLAWDTMLLFLAVESPPTSDKPAVTLAAPTTSEHTPVCLVLRVTDCQRAYAELSARGVRFLTPPQTPPWGGWRCFARDPDGYLIEIEQPGSD